MDNMLEEAGLSCTRADIEAKIEEVATAKHASAWRAESEQFIFCIDLLEISAHDGKANWAVNTLEDRFEKLLA